MKKISFMLIFAFAVSLTAQVAEPSIRTNWYETSQWIKYGLTDITVYGITVDSTLTVGEDGDGHDVKYFGDTASNYVLYDASEDLLSVVQTNASTSGTERAATITLTQTGAGAISEGLKAEVIADVHTGSWVNAIVGKIDYSTGSTGDASGGLAAPICAELNLPARAPSGGAYYTTDLEIEAPANFTAIANPTSFPMAYLRTGLWGNGTATASFEDYGYFFHFDDITDASGNMWYDNTLRILVEGTAFYIPLSDAEGEYSSAYQIDISNATDASSTTTGSIQTDGGLGVAKKIYAGGLIDAAAGIKMTETLTVVDTVMSVPAGGTATPRWGLFTIGGQVFAAIAVADTADIVD